MSETIRNRNWQPEQNAQSTEKKVDKSEIKKDIKSKPLKEYGKDAFNAAAKKPKKLTPYQIFNGNYIFRDNKRRQVFKGEFKDAFPFNDGLAVVKFLDDKKWGFINRRGKKSGQSEFQDVRKYSDGIMAVQFSDGRRGLMNTNYELVDKQGNVILNKKGEEISLYSSAPKLKPVAPSEKSELPSKPIARPESEINKAENPSEALFGEFKKISAGEEITVNYLTELLEKSSPRSSAPMYGFSIAEANKVRKPQKLPEREIIPENLSLIVDLHNTYGGELYTSAFAGGQAERGQIKDANGLTYLAVEFKVGDEVCVVCESPYYGNATYAFRGEQDADWKEFFKEKALAKKADATSLNHIQERDHKTAVLKSLRLPDDKSLYPAASNAA